jgi:hypothetical protein
MNAPLGKGVRTMFLQGFVMNNAGINYTMDEEGQPCWPRHKILLINQLSAMKSREDARTKEGFYDVWFERTDGIGMDPEYIVNHFGDVSESESAQMNWEAGFRHADFALNQKLVTFSSYPSGPAGIATYACSVQNLSNRFGQHYMLPDEILKKVRPFSDYILENNEKLQIQWLLELFPGDEWAMVEAGIISDGSNKVSMHISPVAAQDQNVPAPVYAPAPAIPAARSVSAAPVPVMPLPVAPITNPVPPVPAAVSGAARRVAGLAVPAAPPTGELDLSSQMKALMNKLQSNTNK